MDGILGHKHFVSETANLFTDEKTAHAREKVVTWINELPLASSEGKCDLLVKIQETIVGACPELIEEFLENVLSLAHDPNMEVRKQIVYLIEQICKQKVELLPQVISVISMLVRDRSPQVIKRTIQACGSIYKNGLQWICNHTELTDSIEQSWSVLSLVKAQILDLIDNDNDGIRTNAIKFLEGIVILQSYPDEDSQKKENDFSLENMPENLKIIKRKKLEEEALNIFDILLKFHAATHISSVNLITCTGSLCAIAKLRPSFMGAVVDAFKHLNANLPPTLTDSQVNSVRKFTKMQLIGLLKNRASFEFQSSIRQLLLDLGASQGEIQRSTPKMDKQEQMRRQKRILENAVNCLPKRARFEADVDSDSEQQKMELDEEEMGKQFQKCIRVNEKFLSEHLRTPSNAVSLIMEFLPLLPSQVPTYFMQDYSPIRDKSIPQQITTISKILAEQMTKLRIGPGATAFTKEPPMRPAGTSKVNALSVTNDHSEDIRNQNAPSAHEEEIRKEEATKKLRENMERVKGEQELIERMKARAKTLKLQEVTKPFSRATKEKFLLDSVKHILNAERQCIIGGVSAKRRKILAVMAATFPDKVRYFIFDFIMEDLKQRIDLAFSWLYEEYCLLQGFTRHSYVKSENRPDFAYNELLGKLIAGIIETCEFKEKIVLLRRVFIDAPLLTEDVIDQLVAICHAEELTSHCLSLIRDLAMLRLPRKNKFIQILLTFCVHESINLRERALEHITHLYVEKFQPQRIEEFAVEWINYLEKEIPSVKIFMKEYGRPDVELTWREETTRICLTLLLTLLPHKPEMHLETLYRIYTNTSADIKRTILRAIDPAIKKLGPDNQVLLKYIEDCPKGSETLIIRIVYILTERVNTANPELVQHIRELYANKIKDVRVLIPVLSGLTKQEILNALPKMLKLNHVVVKEIFNRLLGIGAEFANQTIATTPTDVLVSLHTIDINQCDLKLIVKATSICLAEKDIYTQEVLIGVLQQLIDIVPIPTLLMRTIIQSLALYPKLTNFVLSLLQRLILKQVWRQKVIWEGFLKCLQRLKPQSLPVMLHLPGPHLLSALQQCPDLRDPLLEYAESIKDEPMSGITPQILDIISGRAVDVFVTDESGGYMTLDTIKKEIEETEPNITPTVLSVPTPVVTSDVSQPLPPGED